MKILNIFKKESEKNSSNKIEKINKNQLQKIVGGTDTAENKGASFGSGLVVKGSGSI